MKLTSVEDLTDATGEAVEGPIAAWTAGEVEHLAGRGPGGDLLVFWWSPRAGRWQVVNASDEAGATVEGPVTAWVTQSGGVTVEHLAGRGPGGDLLVFWWSPRAGRWQVVNASDEAGATVEGPVTAWVTQSGGVTVEHLAGRGPGGDLLVFWWSPRAGRWQVVNASDEAGATVEGPVTAWVTQSGGVTVEHLAGRGPGGDLLVFWWSPRARRWQTTNASYAAVGPKILGSPVALVTSAGVETIWARSSDDRLVEYWWTSMLEWQACTPSASGLDLATDPAAWLPPGDSVHVAMTTRGGQLLAFTSGHEAQSTDELQRTFLSMRPRRSSRSRIVTILWDAQRPSADPRPDKQVVQDVIDGALDSVRGYFLENSRGEYTIDNVATLGWYDSDFDWAEYWPPGPEPGRDSCAEAIRKAAREFDFKAFDEDDDGELGTHELFVLVIQPGTGDGGGLGRTVGEDYLSRGEAEGIVVDDVLIKTIAEVSIGAPPAPGIVAHELAHPLLGLGDMYWPGDHNPLEAGQYSLMDQDGQAPHVDPAHKLKLGWLRPRLVFRPGSYILPPVQQSGVVLVLMDPVHSTEEYILIENRWRGTSYDQGLPFAGLGVWHVIESQDAYRLPPPFMSRAAWLDPDLDGDEGPVGWSRQGIRMIRPIRTLPLGNTRRLWDGSDPDIGYDLRSYDADAQHARLLWADGTPTGFNVRNMPPAGPRMEVTVDVPAHFGAAVRDEAWLPAVLHVTMAGI